MNERIRELAKSVQCQRHWTEEDIEKFAELIVKEACQHLTDTGQDYARELVEKHFGIEE